MEAARSTERRAPLWATWFDSNARELVLPGDFLPLVSYQELGEEAVLAIATPDHQLALLSVIATSAQEKP